MNKVIISDASCLIALDEIGQIEILKSVFSQIVTTQEVCAEFGKELPTWIAIKTLQNSTKRNELELVLDGGEASAIALALENPKRSRRKEGQKDCKTIQPGNYRYTKGFVISKTEWSNPFRKKFSSRTYQEKI